VEHGLGDLLYRVLPLDHRHENSGVKSGKVTKDPAEGLIIDEEFFRRKQAGDRFFSYGEDDLQGPAGKFRFLPASSTAAKRIRAKALTPSAPRGWRR